MVLFAIRNSGRPFAQTHMGNIPQGRLLTRKDFERPKSVVSGHNPGRPRQIYVATDDGLLVSGELPGI